MKAVKATAQLGIHRDYLNATCRPNYRIENPCFILGNVVLDSSHYKPETLPRSSQ